MTEQALADAILRNSLEILRLTAGEQARVDQVMVELARELRDLVATGRLDAGQKRAVDALIKQADEIIAVGYQRAGASLDTHALAVVVAERTQEIIQDVIPATVRLPSDALLMQLGADVLIEGWRPGGAFRTYAYTWVTKEIDRACRLGGPLVLESEHEVRIRRSVEKLRRQGLSPEEIAARAGLSPDQVERGLQGRRALGWADLDGRRM